MAIFFGGAEVVFDDNAVKQPTNFALHGMVLLCLLLHCSLLLYKRAKSLGEQDYGTQLRQQRVLGSFNPFKSLIFLLSFVVVLLFLFLHKVLTGENIKVCL